MKTRNGDELAMAKSSASNMRRSSVGEQESDMGTLTYKSNATSI